eukprot:UN28233
MCNVHTWSILNDCIPQNDLFVQFFVGVQRPDCPLHAETVRIFWPGTKICHTISMLLRGNLHDGAFRQQQRD